MRPATPLDTSEMAVIEGTKLHVIPVQEHTFCKGIPEEHFHPVTVVRRYRLVDVARLQSGAVSAADSTNIT